MKSCVIGGAGFIGAHLVQQMITQGRQVLVLGRRIERPVNLPKEAQYVSASYSDESVLRNLFKDVDEVYDLAYATVPKSSFEDPIFDIVNNLPSSISLLKAAMDSNLKRLLIVSSGGVVYGPTSIIPITEEVATNPISPYGITKLTIEKYALMFHQMYGLPVTIVRPSNAYGEEQKPFTGQGFIATAMGLMLKEEEIPLFGEQGTIRDYVHVSDVASGIIAAATLGKPGEIYNLSSGVGLSNVEVLKEIEKSAELYGKTARLCILPKREFDVPVSILSHQKLTTHSGWSPKVSFEDGIHSMWHYFASAANLKIKA
jgi:UDP-glucose 4-epimerase